MRDSAPNLGTDGIRTSRERESRSTETAVYCRSRAGTDIASLSVRYGLTLRVFAMWNDITFATRRLVRSPHSTLTAVLTIGIGLGVTAAILTVAWSALVAPLPYSNARSLVHLWEAGEGTNERGPTSYPTFADWRAGADGFVSLEGYDPANFTIDVGDEASMRRGARVTAGFFRLLGVDMSAGRDLEGNDMANGGPRVAIVTEDLARSLGSSDVLNRTIIVNGEPRRIVGVLPGFFHFALLQNATVFVPLTVDERQQTDREQRFIRVIGRLRHDTTLAAATDQLTALMERPADGFRDALGVRTVEVVPLRDALLGNVKPIIESLLLAVSLLVAIMAANLALLTLARDVGRAGELRMRSTLGATRWRLLRLLIVESILPGLVGVVLAVAVGMVATHQVLAAIPDGVRIGMPYLGNAGLGPVAVPAILVASIVLTAASGGAAAILSMRRGDVGVGTRATIGRTDRRLRRGLAASQMAVSVMLLIASVLLVESFGNLMNRDVGFGDPESLVSVRAPLSGPRYQDPGAQRAFYEELLADASSLPGVRDAALINEVPGVGGGMSTFEAIDDSSHLATRPQSAIRIIGGEYFRTMQIPIIDGRSFGTGDRSDSRPVAVVSQSFAQRIAGSSRSSLGRRFRLTMTGNLEWEVVGVVGDVQTTFVDTDSPPTVYLSHLQAPENRMTVVLRTGLPAVVIEKQLRSAVATLDSQVPAYAAIRLDQQFAGSRAVFSRRLPMILIGVFAMSAFGLTLVALYSTSAHEALARRRELGIRAALGATPRVVSRHILSGTILTGLAGIGIGVMGAAAASRVIQPILFGIGPLDWRIYVAVAAVCFAAAAFSSLLPAMRAGSVAPGVALRQD